MVTRPKFGHQIMNFIGHTGGKILDLPAYTSLDTRGKIHFEKTHFYKNGLSCYPLYLDQIATFNPVKKELKGLPGLGKFAQ